MTSINDKNADESSGSSNDIAAEWIIRAQLKISQPKKKAASFGTGDCGAKRSSGSPCRVVYKWNSDAEKSQDQPRNARESRSNVPTHSNSDQNCKSTCSIVLTTEMCPAKMLESGGCTTHTYTFSPDQTQVVHDCKRSEQRKLSISKDVSCQTSDCEVIPIRKQDATTRSPSIERKRKAYTEHRRATDSMVSPRGRSEGRLFTPSRSTRQPSPALSNQSPHSSSKDKKKPPRTVHIDVYCTGSEVDTSNSSNSSSPNIVDDFANLMGQATVIETDDMMLKHQRVVGKRELPRKLANEQKPKISPAEQDGGQQLFDFSRVLQQNTASEKNEVNESKQMLFKKYLGDQRQIQKFNELRSMLHFRRDASDDAISSNYPNSSYSTVRDFTSSSIGSAVANSPSIVFEDPESAWTELDVAIKSGNFITPVGSFKQWDKGDELQKMKQFERLWKRDEEPTRDLLSQHKLMENFMFSRKPRKDSDNSANISESDQNYQKSNEMGNISDSSPSTVISYSHRRPPNVPIPTVIESPEKKPSEARSVTSSTGSYSKEHLALSHKFGSVIKTMRKPGHHIGPVRNPACLCETCKRWVLERDQVHGRGRAFSFGDTPITKSTFWKRNNRYYV